MPSIQRLHETVKDEGIAVVTLSTDDSAGKVAKFMKDNGYTMPALMLGNEYPGAFKTNSIPLTLILDGDGEIAMRQVGSREWDSSDIVSLLRSFAEQDHSGHDH